MFSDSHPIGTSSADVAGGTDPLPIPAAQRAWRHPLLEELRAAWLNAEEMLQKLPAAPNIAVVEACAADTRKQLAALKEPG
jgi:hypothetical protein